MMLRFALKAYKSDESLLDFYLSDLKDSLIDLSERGVISYNDDDVQAFWVHATESNKSYMDQTIQELII